MAPRFLLDEHISPRVAAMAGKAGLDVLAVAGSELSGRDDEAILREAVREGRILVTYNIADFVAIYKDLLKEGVEVPGLVFIDSRTLPTSELARMAKALRNLAREIENGEVDPAGGIFLTAR